MNNFGKEAEKLTEIIIHLYGNTIEKTECNYKWHSNANILRETDVCVLLKNGDKIAFEVRDRHGVQKIDWIDSVIGKYKDSPFSSIWVCTHNNCRLSREAIKQLNAHNIKWLPIISVDSDNDEIIASFPAIKPLFEEMIIENVNYKNVVIEYKNTRDNSKFEMKLTDIIKNELYSIID